MGEFLCYTLDKTHSIIFFDGLWIVGYLCLYAQLGVHNNFSELKFNIKLTCMCVVHIM